jgi:hypothetical protein
MKKLSFIAAACGVFFNVQNANAYNWPGAKCYLQCTEKACKQDKTMYAQCMANCDESYIKKCRAAGQTAHANEPNPEDSSGASESNNLQQKMDAFQSELDKLKTSDEENKRQLLQLTKDVEILKTQRIETKDLTQKGVLQPQSASTAPKLEKTEQGDGDRSGQTPNWKANLKPVMPLSKAPVAGDPGHSDIETLRKNAQKQIG